MEDSRFQYVIVSRKVSQHWRVFIFSEWVPFIYKPFRIVIVHFEACLLEAEDDLC